MIVAVDVWLRGSDFATTATVADIPRLPKDWTDDDVRLVLEGMLKTMHRLKHPGEADRAIALRGLSWIVNPYEEGGVVIAIEITLGAAIAGPFEIDKATLEAMIARVLERPPAPPSTTVH
jgi:hypothetical protein